MGDPGGPAAAAGAAGRIGAAADRGLGPGFEQRTNYLRFHMARLRRKLEDNPARPRHLVTEPGMGYRYQK
jgi:DNA-binding response OmpR family regulator